MFQGENFTNSVDVPNSRRNENRQSDICYCWKGDTKDIISIDKEFANEQQPKRIGAI